MSRQTLVTSVHPDGHSKKEDLKPSSSSRGYQQRLIDLGLRWHVSTIPQGTVADSDFLMPTGLDAWARVASQLGDRDSAEPSPVPRLERWPHVVEFTRGQHSGSRRPSAWDPATMLGCHGDAEVHIAGPLRCTRGSHRFFIALTRIGRGLMSADRQTTSPAARIG